MKQGMKFENLYDRIIATANCADDFVVSGNTLQMSSDGKHLLHCIPDVAPELHIDDVAHDQFSYRLGIPRAYYKKMRDVKPALLSDNVNAWLEDSEKHMLRTLDNSSLALGSNPITSVRALLSQKYRRIDNHDVLSALMPKIGEKDFEVQSCDVTPYNMFVKITFPYARADVTVGDTVEAGVIIRNSEVGWGSCSVELFIHRLVCTNGMVIPEKVWSARKYHSGAKVQFDESTARIVSEQTQQLADAAFLSSFHDVIEAARNEKTIQLIADDYRKASDDKIAPGMNIEESVERLSKKLLITQDEQTAVLEHFVRDGDFSRWGFANAVTRSAQDATSYERATELERVGGHVIAMPTADFQRAIAA